MSEQSALLIKERLKRVFEEPQMHDMCASDIVLFFEQLGAPWQHAFSLTSQLIKEMISDKSLQEIETDIRSILKNVKIGNESFFELLTATLGRRNDIILSQIQPFLKQITGKVIDFGAGNGLIAQTLHNRSGLDTEAVEVRNWKHKEVSIPFLIFDGRMVPVDDKYYEAAIMTNVAHHEENNEVILQELTRITRKRLVIIETVPENDGIEQRERTFVTDALWNRFLFYADIPVPGTYELAEGWIRRFKKYGWKVTHSEELGYDIPTVRVRHHLLVFDVI
jgi:SAM-dependent methyltransferase